MGSENNGKSIKKSILLNRNIADKTQYSVMFIISLGRMEYIYSFLNIYIKLLFHLFFQELYNYCSQLFKINLVLKTNKFLLNFLKVHYLNLYFSNTLV